MKMATWLPPRISAALRCVSALAVVAMLGAGAVRAQNLDQGKPPARLFADGCASCHHSPRHLAKGRFRLSLFLFLQQHYATSSNSAWELTSYLESLDNPPRGKPRAAAAASPPASSSRSPRSSLRPPMPVPQQ